MSNESRGPSSQGQYWYCDQCEERYPSARRRRCGTDYELEGYAPIEVEHNGGNLWICLKCANEWDTTSWYPTTLTKAKGDE